MTAKQSERTIRITAGSVVAEARLNASRTAAALWDALPLEAKAETWGDEVYFGIGLALEEESPKAVVEPGDLGYWSGAGRRSASNARKRMRREEAQR